MLSSLQIQEGRRRFLNLVKAQSIAGKNTYIGETMISREKVRRHFVEYVSAYNAADVKVKLKIDHTWRTASLCDRLAVSLGLPDEDRDLAWLSGMLHDIGRFEQLRRYNTFVDRLSVNHAMLSADILFEDGEDYERFLETLRRYKDEENFEILVFDDEMQEDYNHKFDVKLYKEK